MYKLKKIKESVDYRKLFIDSPYIHRKTEYIKVTQPAGYLTDEMESALVDLVEKGYIIDLDSTASVFDRDFPPDHLEWIVHVDSLGYFYVNTEGYDYARYIMKIPEGFAQTELEKVWY